jgi:hypothetical protein
MQPAAAASAADKPAKLAKPAVKTAAVKPNKAFDAGPTALPRTARCLTNAGCHADVALHTTPRIPEHMHPEIALGALMRPRRAVVQDWPTTTSLIWMIGVWLV